MNVAAWFRTHQKQAMVGGAVAAVGLGLYTRKKRQGGGPVLSSTQPGKSTVIAPATYDSTAGDLYNSIEPLIENLQHQIDSLGQTLSNPAAATAPVTVTPPPAQPAIPTPLVPATVALAPASPAAFAPNIAAPVPAPYVVPTAPATSVAVPQPGQLPPNTVITAPNPIPGETGTITIGNTGGYGWVFG